VHCAIILTIAFINKYLCIVHCSKVAMPDTSVIPSNEARKMILSKMKLLGAAVGVAAVIASGALAWVHNGAATADQGNGNNYVVGQDGKLIGAASNPSIRSQWQREGFPN
jgi:hypothetical protein